MKRLVTIASVLAIAATVAGAQAPSGQAPAINWNSMAPWGEQPNLPFDQQRKAPFKIISLMNEKIALEKS
jgi:hypothetical protein